MIPTFSIYIYSLWYLLLVFLFIPHDTYHVIPCDISNRTKRKRWYWKFLPHIVQVAKVELPARKQSGVTSHAGTGNKAVPRSVPVTAWSGTGKLTIAKCDKILLQLRDFIGATCPAVQISEKDVAVCVYAPVWALLLPIGSCWIVWMRDFAKVCSDSSPSLVVLLFDFSVVL